MPLVTRASDDYMSWIPLVDIMVNPTNISGAAGAGIALLFRERYPEWYAAYQDVCNRGVFEIGRLHVFPVFDQQYRKHITIVSIATKRHWTDTSVPADVDAGCQRFAEYLRLYPFHTVAIPLLGSGLGRMDADEAYAMMLRHFDPLPNILHLSRRPRDLPAVPLYLGVFGSREYSDYDRIDLGVCEALIEFALSWSDFTAGVSGGARGVDKIAAGTGESGDTEINIMASHKLKPIVCQADWDRYGNSAGFIRNRTAFDISTHIVTFVGTRSVGTRMMIDLINAHNSKVARAEEHQTQGLARGTLDPFTSPPPPVPVKKYHINIDLGPHVL